MWSEQDPDDWVEGVEAAVAAIRRHAPAAFEALAGVGLSGQMHGATLLDADDKPLRPAILWNDGRSFAECAELKRRVPDVEKRTGNLVMPGFTAPKMLWVAAHEPDDRQGDETRAAAQGLCAAAPLGRGGLGNVGRLGHAPGSMSASGAGTRPARRDRPFARRDAQAGRRLGSLGLSVAATSRRPGASAGAKIPIAGGGGDNAASAIGVGATAAGAGFVSLGTSGVVFSVTDRYVSLPERTLHAFCHALPQRWHGMSVMLSAASSLSWIAGDPRARAATSASSWRRRRPSPIEERGRLRADLPALSQRRAHAA